jgi:lipopolysaccharide/colanic/teichoic acid biosynthesis glycosyltransferase
MVPSALRARRPALPPMDRSPVRSRETEALPSGGSAVGAALPRARQRPTALRELMRPLRAPGDQLVDGETRQVADERAGHPSFYVRRGKRWFDLGLLALCLPVALLLALPIAALNWLLFRTWREILFTQPRIGRGGRPFRLYKFRTMRAARAGAFDSWSNGGDQLRVTRFGRLLRNSHLDELPQLLNVARGEMSLIGPRPEMVEIEHWAQREVPGFGVRLAARPGITGLAQVVQGYTGRDVEAYREKLELSLTYLRTMSLRCDLWILWRTAWTMVKLDGWRWHERLTGTRAEREARRLATPNDLWS